MARDEGLEVTEAVVEGREMDLVEAPTSTVPVTVARPSCVQRSTYEL